MNLDDLDHLRAIDAQNYLAEIDALPERVAQAWALAGALPLPVGQHLAQPVILAGVGASALAGALAQAYAAGAGRVPLVPLAGGPLPAWVGPHTPVIALSHSGESADTLAIARAALAAGAPLLAITRGGHLAALAEAAGQPVWRFQHDGPARAALADLLLLTLGALARLGWLPDPAADVPGAVAALRAQQAQFSAQSPVMRNPAKRLAGQFMDRVPVLCAGGLLAPVAQRWKSQINELAKAVAVSEALPAIIHGSVAGTLFPERLIEKHLALFLRSSFETPAEARQAEVAREIYMTAGFNTDAVQASGASPLAHLLTALQYGDYTACYLAIAYGIDPTPVPQIDYVKEQLA